jgi:hypothetical protein
MEAVVRKDDIVGTEWAQVEHEAIVRVSHHV